GPMMPKPRLIPIKVPWQVSPSVSRLRLSVAESEEPTRVWADVNTLREKGAEAKRIIVSFGRALRARFSPAWSDAEVIREGHFDWSAVPKLDLEDLNKAQSEFQRSWRETGECPDSGFYEVEGSLWASDERARASLRHFLIVGNDAFVEVLADAWEWEVAE